MGGDIIEGAEKKDTTLLEFKIGSQINRMFHKFKIIKITSTAKL